MKRSGEKVDAKSVLHSALLDSTALVDTITVEDVQKALGKSDAKGKGKASSEAAAIALRGHLVAQRAAIRKQVRANIDAFELPPAKSTAKAAEEDTDDDDDGEAPYSSKPVHPAARAKSRPSTLPDKSAEELKDIDEVIEMLEEEKRALEHEVSQLERDLANLKTAIETSLEDLNTVELPSEKTLAETRKAIAAIVGS